MKKTNNNFQYFTNSEDPKQKRKEGWRKFLKWFKIVFYVFVFGLTITGCVQAFALKNSYNVGNGIEFYRNKNDIAPRVNTLKNKTEEINYTENNNDKKEEKFTVDVLTADTEANFFVRDSKVLEALRNQTEKNGGNYGQPDKYLVAFQLPENKSLEAEGLSTAKDSIFGTNGNDPKYLFRSQTSPNYEYVTNAKNSDIYLFAFKYDWKNDKEKDLLPKVLNTKFMETATTSITIVDKQGNEAKVTVPVTTSDGSLAITDISGVLHVNTPKNIYKEDKSNFDEAQRNANRMFARDILQAFYDYSFGKGTEFAKELGATPSEFIKNLIDNIGTKINESNGTTPLFYLTPKQFSMLNQYQKVMSEYLGQLQYFNRDNVSMQRWSELEKAQLNADQTQYVDKFDYKKNTLYSQNASVVPFGGDYAIQPIVTWGEAWKYGPFYGLLVYPLSVLIQSLRQAMPDWDGWAAIIAILIAIILTRLIGLAITFRSTVMQQVMEELKYKKAAIEAKYKGLEQNKAMKMKKQQELSALYSKYNINPADQFGTMILSMPLFFAMWRVIQSIPEIKETTWLGVNFASISYKRLFDGNWAYLWVLAAVIIFQILSMLIPKLLNKKNFKRRTTIAEAEALKKSERTQTIMMIVFTVITVMFSAGVQVYWIFGSIWTILQTIVIHYLTQSQWFKRKYMSKYLKR
ncbi:membrane protein insertase YidC [Mycoplasma seminis]|uniref:Membrane protein insertase YidC n=1 Tax=Mycoplasma seminis TaxID=512749 RepID=A0ABY9HB42_9MOLU|nr:membrane protein insertase YidC [Mycoplasma seminis]WLP85558.1 membrane protein insertase YidC [Mycoplasma seminis]